MKNKTIPLHVVGIRYYKDDYVKYLSELAPGDILTLEPEPSNQFDSNAVLVVHEIEEIGHICHNDLSLLGKLTESMECTVISTSLEEVSIEVEVTIEENRWQAIPIEKEFPIQIVQQFVAPDTKRGNKIRRAYQILQKTLSKDPSEAHFYEEVIKDTRRYLELDPMTICSGDNSELFRLAQHIYELHRDLPADSPDYLPLKELVDQLKKLNHSYSSLTVKMELYKKCKEEVKQEMDRHRLIENYHNWLTTEREVDMLSLEDLHKEKTRLVRQHNEFLNGKYYEDDRSFSDMIKFVCYQQLSHQQLLTYFTCVLLIEDFNEKIAKATELSEVKCTVDYTNRKFAKHIKDASLVNDIMRVLHEAIDIQASPKAMILPLRAAKEMKLISGSMPLSDFIDEFGEISSTTFSRYFNGKASYTMKELNTAKKLLKI